MAHGFYAGQRLSFDGNLCTVRYAGDVEGTKGLWLGVEWDDTSRGKHGGEHNGKRYFSCLSRKLTAASFVRPTRATDQPYEFVDAVRHKYASDEFNGHGVYTVSNFQDENEVIRISGKEVEEVGFEKIRLQLANLRQLRILLVDSLRVHRPQTRGLQTSNATDLTTDVADISPNVRELDVSRNLFEEWSEVMDICRQMPRLTSLRCEGNRFSRLEARLSNGTISAAPFTRITTLGLDDTLLSWPQVSLLCQSFPQLTTLSLNGNEYDKLEPVPIPQNLTILNLERNEFTSLEGLRPLTSSQTLQRLNLKSNQISQISIKDTANPTFAPALTELDLAYNEINTWTFIDRLAPTIPGLKSLRISHNPLYQTLRNADGKEVPPEDGYMLTMARLGALTRLNFSTIDPKERLNAEIYYLSQITRELFQARDAARPQILARHARYEELCRMYDQPSSSAAQVQQPAASTVDPRSLAAGLVAVTFKLADGLDTKGHVEKEWSTRLPKSLSIYAIQGLVGQRFELPPMRLQLVWETGEVDVVQQGLDEDSEDEDLASDGQAELAQTKMREDLLVPQTRSLGTWVDSVEATVRVEWDQVAVARARRAKELLT